MKMIIVQEAGTVFLLVGNRKKIFVHKRKIEKTILRWGTMHMWRISIWWSISSIFSSASTFRLKVGGFFSILSALLYWSGLKFCSGFIDKDPQYIILIKSGECWRKSVRRCFSMDTDFCLDTTAFIPKYFALFPFDLESLPWFHYLWFSQMANF